MTNALEALERIQKVANECVLAAYASAGDPSRQDDLKLFSIWAGTLRKALDELSRVSQWRPIESCPSDGSNVWVFGGYHTDPEMRAADGEWWRSKAVTNGPTLWQPVSIPAAPREGG